jgi:iron-sulfur cluster repair protein YtfE (RIC family)
MDSGDVIDPADRAIHEILGRIADRTEDQQRRQRILEVMVTVPPIAQWPPDALEQWREFYAHVRGLRRRLEQRELEAMYDAGGDGER